MKDNFSDRSREYAQFRPSYPSEVFDFINDAVDSHENAWDCGTGNGQVALELAKTFNKVYATDISEKQLSQAPKVSNVEYRVEQAEKSSFPNNSFDLIVAAQAIHWFDIDKFYQEVNRTLKEDGLIAIIGYALISTEPPLEEIISHFYHHVLGGFWDPERKYVDDEYQTIPFPFEEIKTPSLFIEYNWTLEHLVGYLGTWSAVKHYKDQNKTNPVDEIQEHLATFWANNELVKAKFPILFRIGKLK